MGRIEYLAVLSEAPRELAAFYVRYLGFKELGQSADGDISLTEGSANFTIFRKRSALREPRMETGLHHIGVAVDSIAAIEERYRRLYPRGVIVREVPGLHTGAIRIYDPECNPVTVSETGYSVPQGSFPGPKLAHIALNALDPSAICDFFVGVFGFEELFEAHAESRKRVGYKNRHVGDGRTNVAIQAFYNDREGFEPRFGIAHMGLRVNDLAALQDSLSDTATIKARPAGRVQSEVRMRDPQGNGCDLSQRGWEVSATPTPQGATAAGSGR